MSVHILIYRPKHVNIGPSLKELHRTPPLKWWNNWKSKAVQSLWTSCHEKKNHLRPSEIKFPVKNNMKWINSYSLLCIVHFFLCREAMKFEKWPHCLSDMDCGDVSTTGEMMHFLFFFLSNRLITPVPSDLLFRWIILFTEATFQRPPQMWKKTWLCVFCEPPHPYSSPRAT